MKDILKKYPAPVSAIWIAPDEKYSPDFVMDLHGYSQAESEEKLCWLRAAIQEKHWKKVRIITGVGRGVLFALVHRKCKNGFFAPLGKIDWKVLENKCGVEIVI